jgi:hypothetical protein
MIRIQKHNRTLHERYTESHTRLVAIMLHHHHLQKVLPCPNDRLPEMTINLLLERREDGRPFHLQKQVEFMEV